jgi:ADP-ribose pyrophosphatase YjhB (NUDIX family)
VIELGETLADAVEREVREETGAVVQFRRVVDAYSNVVRDERHSVRFHYVVVYSLCTYTEGEIKASSDAAAVAWVSRSEVEQLDMHDYLKTLLGREDLISPA